MDVRIFLRMATRYVLARTALAGAQIGVVTFIIVRFIVPVLEQRPRQAAQVILALAAVAALIRMLVMRRTLADRAREWIDRKFFREQYDAELVLSELADRVRSITDPATLIDTVSRRISEVLHVPQIVVLVRSREAFRLQHAIGLDFDSPVMLSESSPPIQQLAQASAPVVLHRERLDEWFLKSERNELRVLEQMHARVLLPLPGRNKLMGLMILGPKLTKKPYSPSDLRLLQSVAVQAGLGLEVSDLAASLADEASKRERIQRELEIAREVQQRLFPQDIPVVPGLDLAGHCRAAQEVGGDYYDLIRLEDGRLGLAIGDISGKGISAALLMASLRAALRAIAADGITDLACMMKKLNRLVYESSAVNRYATLFFATYEPVKRELQYVNAGHYPPILIRRTDTSSDAFRLDRGGPVVGLLPDVSYVQKSINLQTGDVVLAYTDGIIEATTENGDEWGEDRLLTAARVTLGQCAENILHSIFEAAKRFTASAVQHDDTTLLVLKVTG